MAETAYAAVLTAPRTFEIRDVPVPEIGPGEGIVRMEAAGLCGTDYEQFAGDLGVGLGKLFPIIPGHELLGRIDRIGAEAARAWGVKEGDRVIVESSLSCGQCEYCQVGRNVLCDANGGYGLRMGYDTPPHLWGGYASHLYLDPRTRLHRAPDDIPTAPMSLFNPMANAVRWAWERPGLREGQSIVIAGPGQRGLMAVVVAREVGAGPIVVTGTRNDAGRLAQARRLGADATVVVEDEDPVARVRDLTGGRGADVVLDVAAGSPEPILQAVEMVKKGGTIVVAGLKTHNAVRELYTDKLIWKEIAMLGVLSSDWSSTSKGLEILKRRWRDLAELCTHSYPVAEAETAVRVLGREIADGPEPVHIHIDARVAP